jgi:hypothetical protein
MPTITIKDDKLTAEVYVQCTREHECTCGQCMTLTMNMPEDVTVNGAITVDNAKCPSCGETVVIPAGRHYVENYRLLTE